MNQTEFIIETIKKYCTLFKVPIKDVVSSLQDEKVIIRAISDRAFHIEGCSLDLKSVKGAVWNESKTQSSSSQPASYWTVDLKGKEAVIKMLNKEGIPFEEIAKEEKHQPKITSKKLEEHKKEEAKTKKEEVKKVDKKEEVNTFTIFIKNNNGVKIFDTIEKKNPDKMKRFGSFAEYIETMDKSIKTNMEKNKGTYEVLKSKNKKFIYSGLLFEKRDEQFIVVGAFDGKTESKLGSDEIEICEKNKWEYDEEMVEYEEVEDHEED